MYHHDNKKSLFYKSYWHMCYKFVIKYATDFPGNFEESDEWMDFSSEPL